MLKTLFGLGSNNIERRGESIPENSTILNSDDSENMYDRTNIEDILYSHRVPVFLVVHSESCPACRNFMPSWSNLCKNIVKQYPEADNIDEKNTPVVGSIYSERVDNLHDLYMNGVPTTADELVQYVPTIMRISPDRKDPKKVDVVKFNKDRSEDNLYDFYKQFKNETGVMYGTTNIDTTRTENENDNGNENIKLNISGGAFINDSKNTKMKTKPKKKLKKKPKTKPKTKTRKKNLKYKKKYKSKRKKRRKRKSIKYRT